MTDAADSAVAQRSDGRGAVHLLGHLAALGMTGYAVLRWWSTWFVVPALVAHGFVLIFLFCAEHETIHRTAFRSKRLNDGVSASIGLLLLLPSRWFRLFHAAHHRYTQDPVLDPELDGWKPPTRSGILLQQSGLLYWKAMATVVRQLVRGRADASWLPKGHAGRVVREARMMVAVYGLVAVVSVATGSLLAVHAVNSSMDGGDYDQPDTTLAKVASAYNLVIIDSPPGGDAIHRAAMTAAHAVLIPTQPDQGPIDGLALVAKGVANLRKRANPGLTILGVVLGPMPTSATRLREDTLVRLHGLLGEKVHLFNTTIRYAQAVAVHCRELGLLAHEYEDQAREQSPWHKRMKLTKEERATMRSFSAAAPALAADYQALTTEVLAHFSELVTAS